MMQGLVLPVSPALTSNGANACAIMSGPKKLTSNAYFNLLMSESRTSPRPKTAALLTRQWRTPPVSSRTRSAAARMDSGLVTSSSRGFVRCQLRALVKLNMAQVIVNSLYTPLPLQLPACPLI